MQAHADAHVHLCRVLSLAVCPHSLHIPNITPHLEPTAPVATIAGHVVKAGLRSPYEQQKDLIHKECRHGKAKVQGHEYVRRAKGQANVQRRM